MKRMIQFLEKFAARTPAPKAYRELNGRPDEANHLSRKRSHQNIKAWPMSRSGIYAPTD